MEVSTPFPFLNQEDCCFSNLYSLFLEPDEAENDTVPKKRTKLENEPFFPNNNNNSSSSVMENDYFEFDKYEQSTTTGPGSEPDSSPGSTGTTFNFHSLAGGSSGHIYFQGPTGPDHVRVKRARSETDPVPVPVQPGQHRRLWVKSRSKAWWEEVNRSDYPEAEFIKAFRMSRATFELVCDELDASVFKKDTMLRQAIPVRQRVAVCVYRLATGEPLRLVSKRFGLGISTCHKLVLEVCSAMKAVLMPRFIRWPDAEGMEKVKKGFRDVSGIPDVCGAIYTTHVPIIAPKASVSAYFNKWHTERNQKTSYTVTVQGVVGPDGVFNDVCIGWPGSMTDEKILEKSALYQRAAKGGLQNGSYLVGNSNFPLTDWVLTPYVGQSRTWAQHGFNERVELVQKVAKGAFERLKGRWGCLQKRTEVKLQDLPVVLGACCVLHNICEMRGEVSWGGDVAAFEVFDDEVAAEEVGPRSVGAVKARDQIAHRLLHHSFGSGL